MQIEKNRGPETCGQGSATVCIKSIFLLRHRPRSFLASEWVSQGCGGCNSLQHNLGIPSRNNTLCSAHQSPALASSRKPKRVSESSHRPGFIMEKLSSSQAKKLEHPTETSGQRRPIWNVKVPGSLSFFFRDSLLFLKLVLESKLRKHFHPLSSSDTT